MFQNISRMGLASVVYDVLDDCIIHASFHRYLASERSAAIQNTVYHHYYRRN